MSDGAFHPQTPTHRLSDDELTRAAMEVYRSARRSSRLPPDPAELRATVHIIESWRQAAALFAAWRRGEIELDVAAEDGWTTSALGWASIPDDAGDEARLEERASFFATIRGLDKP